MVKRLTIISHNEDSGPNGSFDSASAVDDISAGIAQIENDEFIYISSQPSASQAKSQPERSQSNNLRQTTLFGRDTLQRLPSHNVRRSNWPLVNKDEPPTHHELDDEALATWVYPTNLGSTRDYQFNIVSRGLFHNMLVALPTGLGKTFIAAAIMLNWFRWTKKAQIVFVAPTKPLVSQQVEACFGIAGIPRSYTSMLTGGISPGLRAEEWKSKRLFFMTPQTIVNDLKTGICDPKRIVLLVVDEAHRATGNYSYVEVVKFIRRFNESFRVLALTATPGSKVEQVQEVINGLNIARVEIRTEHSLDIREYVHKRKNETILFDTTEEMELVMELFSNALRPVLAKLTAQNAYWSRDPMSLTPFGLTQARQKWMLSDAGRKANMGLKAMMHGIFTILASLAHSITLLKNHGIGPFYHTVVGFRNSISEGGNGSKYRKQINEDESFNKMMNLVRSWISNPDFIGHPKLEYLQKYILNHFLDAGEGRNTAGIPPSGTRVMVFAHFRDSAEEIVRVLNRNQPMIRAHVFVGQANAKGSAGMDQKQQLEMIQKFKAGTYNTLVATSIGEEGLDIGEIDLIICYDSSASPIRMLQRMGRTGRKRAGNVILLLMRGKEERDSLQANDNYEKMQEMIASGTKFTFCEDRSRRILPRTANPVVDKRNVEIPIENTQSTELPEPKRRSSKAPPKRPPKKFHMPDGVNTGFVNASTLGDDAAKPATRRKSQAKPLQSKKKEVIEEEALPALEDVLLNTKDQRYLSQNYQFVPGYDGETYEVNPVTLYRFPTRQRVLDRTGLVANSAASISLSNLHRVDNLRVDRWRSITEQNIEFVRSLTTTDPNQKFSSVDIDNDDENNKNTFSKNNDSTDLASSRVNVTGHQRQSKPYPRSRGGRTIDDNRKYLFSPLSASASSAPPSSPPATAPEMRVFSQGISLGSSSPPARKEDEDQIDSSMADFVVGDEAPLGTATSDGLPPESSLPVLADVLTSGDGGGTAGGEKDDSGSDNDIPDVNTVIHGRNLGKTVGISGITTTKRKLDKSSKETNVGRKVLDHGRKRRVIVDSSDC